MYSDASIVVFINIISLYVIYLLYNAFISNANSLRFFLFGIPHYFYVNILYTNLSEMCNVILIIKKSVWNYIKTCY